MMDGSVVPGNDVRGNDDHDVMAAVTTCRQFCISFGMRDFPPRRIVCLTEETVETLYLLGEQDRIVGATDRAERLAQDLEQRLATIAATPRPAPRPKVYFEEWDDPLISGIGWVSELIEIAGGEDALPHLRVHKAAKDRIIAPDVVRDAAPDVILASWCGKKVVPDRIRKRDGWSAIPAVRNDRIVEIKSTIILQPGPAALTDGLDAIVKALWPQHL